MPFHLHLCRVLKFVEQMFHPPALKGHQASANMGTHSVEVVQGTELSPVVCNLVYVSKYNSIQINKQYTLIIEGRAAEHLHLRPPLGPCVSKRDDLHSHIIIGTRREPAIHIGKAVEFKGAIQMTANTVKQLKNIVPIIDSS